MKVDSYSIVAGTEACNAQCPYCVSRMTPGSDIGPKDIDVNWRNFDIASRYARDCGASTVMITGKGEPTLFPEQITEYTRRLQPYRFSFIELQTNGILLWEKRDEFRKYLKEWYDNGMTTISVSITHYDSGRNRETYLPDRKSCTDLEGLIDDLHSQKFAVRLSCVMLKGYIDSEEELTNLVDFARKNKVEQLTVRPVGKPKSSRNSEILSWASEHAIGEEKVGEIKGFLDDNAAKLMELGHGAVVYDMEGQNICLSHCLSDGLITPPDKETKQLIFFSDGRLVYDWQYKGAVLL